MRKFWMGMSVVLMACGTTDTDKTDDTDTDAADTDVEETDTTELTRVEEVQALTGVVADGETVYNDANTGNCVSCHASTGTGGIGPDLTASLPTYPVEDAIEIILEGEGLMGAYDGFLTDQQIADVTAYIYDAFGG